jgi:hypothetical protein
VSSEFESGPEEALEASVRTKFATLSQQYHEDIVAVTCTAQELELLACYREREEGGGDVLECADLLAKYRKCVRGYSTSP